MERSKVGGKLRHKGASPENRLNSVFVALFHVFNVISHIMCTRMDIRLSPSFVVM